jgi:FtsH-binding integral membrane protein
MATKIKKGLGLILLSIWLIATGLIVLFRFSFVGEATVMAILAIAAGVVLLIEK